MNEGRMLRRTLKLLSLVALGALLVVLLAACGEDEDLGGTGGTGGNTGSPGSVTTTPPGDPTPTNPPPASPTTTPDRIDHAMGADDIILQIRQQGGFVPVAFHLTRMPDLTLYGNGCIVTQGPMIEIYPQPMLPNLLVTCLTEEGVQAILRAAQDAGLLEADAHYPLDLIADASTTVFEVNAGGKTVRVSAYALAEGGDMDSPNATPGVAEARAKLAEFRNQLSDLQSWIPANDVVSEEQPYELERFQIIFQPADAPDVAPVPTDIEVETVAWPLTTPIAEIAQPYDVLQQASCAVVEGTDAQTLHPVLEEANQLTRFTEGDTEYVVYLRPLLAGEAGCQEPSLV